MDLSLQAKVLRVLESSEIEKVGSNETIKVDVRIISATNKNIENMISEKKFRQDLFHRINVFPMTIPSLIDHPGDIPLIAYRIIDSLKKKHNLNVNYLTPGALKLMKNYHWPGNVRELENILERAVLLTNETVITSGDILPLLGPKKDRSGALDVTGMVIDEEKSDFKKESLSTSQTEKSLPISKVPQTLKEIEKKAIVEALVYTEWNMTKTANVLGVSRMTLYRKIDSYGIEENE